MDDTVLDYKLKAIKRIQAYKDTFSTESGKVVLADLERMFYMSSPMYKSDKVNDLIYNEGMRNVILYVKQVMNQDMESFKKDLSTMEND